MKHLLFYVKEERISPTYSFLNFFISLSLQFSNIKKIIFLISGTESYTKLKLSLHMNSRLMYHLYLNRTAGIYLFLYFFNFLPLKFQKNNFFVTLFCEAYKVGNLIHTWAKGWSIVYTKYKQPEYQNILVPLFFSFFLSLQLAKIKNLHLQNCFSLPLIATVGGMLALLTLCYIFSQI